MIKKTVVISVVVLILATWLFLEGYKNGRVSINFAMRQPAFRDVAYKKVSNSKEIHSKAKKKLNAYAEMKKTIGQSGKQRIEMENLDAMTMIEQSTLFFDVQHCIEYFKMNKINSAKYADPEDAEATECAEMDLSEYEWLKQTIAEKEEQADLKKVLGLMRDLEEIMEDAASGNTRFKKEEEVYQYITDLMVQYLDVLFYSQNPDAVFYAGSQFSWLRMELVFGGFGHIHFSDKDVSHPMDYDFYRLMNSPYSQPYFDNHVLYGLFRYCYLRQWQCERKIKERYMGIDFFDKYSQLNGYELFTQVVSNPYMIQKMEYLQSITH